MQCGKHGYSARDYGFRFDIDVDVADMGSAGGRTDTKSERGVGDGHGHVYIRKEEKEKERGKDKDETVISASFEAIEIEIPCENLMRECLFVPIPIPIHPHAGDPLLVEDPGSTTPSPHCPFVISFPFSFFPSLNLSICLPV